MSRSSAEYVREEPSSQPFDVFGLVAGVLFAFVGLAYLVGGHDALSGHESLVLPIVLVLVGVAGVAGSGLVRRSWFSRTPQPAAPGSSTAATGFADDRPGTEPAPGAAHDGQDDPFTTVERDDPGRVDLGHADPYTPADGTGSDEPRD